MMGDRNIAIRLMSMASQENNDGEEFDLMMDGYREIIELEDKIIELEVKLDSKENIIESLEDGYYHAASSLFDAEKKAKEQDEQIASLHLQIARLGKELEKK